MCRPGGLPSKLSWEHLGEHAVPGRRPVWWKSLRASADDAFLQAHEAFERERRRSHGAGRGSLVGKIVAQALVTFARSQLQQCGALSVHLKGQSRDLLLGRVRSATLHAQNAVYKGVTVTRVDLAASSIQLRVGGNRNGSLLQSAFPVGACISISPKDLNSSLQSPLLLSALTELFSIPPGQPVPRLQVALQHGALEFLLAGPTSHSSAFLPLKVQVDLALDGQRLFLHEVG